MHKPGHHIFLAMACLLGLGVLTPKSDAARSGMNFSGTVPATGELSLTPRSAQTSHFGDEAGFRVTVWNGTNKARALRFYARTVDNRSWPQFDQRNPFIVKAGSGQKMVVAIPHTSTHTNIADICVEPVHGPGSLTACGRFTMKRLGEALPMM